MPVIQRALLAAITTTGGFLRAAALIAISGGVAGGVILQAGMALSATHTTDQSIASNLLAKETVTGCVSAGSGTGCLQIIVGVTQDAHVFTKSGGYIAGPLANPNFVVSGSLMKIGGGYPDSTAKLEVVGNMSGTYLTLKPSSGTAALVLNQNTTNDGVHICISDTDGGGYTLIETLNGTVSGKIAGAGQCP